MSIKEKATVFIITLLCIIFFFNIGFALEDENYNETVSSNSISKDFNFEFVNEKVVRSYGILNDMAQIHVSSDHKDIYLDNINLEFPGAYVEFAVDIINKGKKPAKIEKLNVTGFENSNVIKFHFLNSQEIFNCTLEPKEKCTIKFVIEWDKNCSTITDETVNFNIEIPIYEK